MTTTDNPFTARIAQAAKEGYLPGRHGNYTRTRRSCAPMTTTTVATGAQVSLCRLMLNTKDLNAETRPAWNARLWVLAGSTEAIEALTKEQASKLIDHLKTLPDQFPLVDMPKVDTKVSVNVPAGRYAVEINGELIFAAVDRPESGKWAGYTFVKRQVGPELVRIHRSLSDKILTAIRAAGPEAASIRYGQELGICGRCNTELTNEESRARGIGPICKDKAW